MVAALRTAVGLRAGLLPALAAFPPQVVEGLPVCRLLRRTLAGRTHRLELCRSGISDTTVLGKSQPKGGTALGLEGKVAIITGASRGIGEAIAQRFASDGAAVAVTARTVEEGDHRFAGSITRTVQSITDAGGTALPVAADLSHPEDRARLLDTVQKELGPIDVLVNNAAITYFEPVADFDEHHFRLMFEVQVRAPFELVQMVLPGMRERGKGWILNISSGAARHPSGPPYRGPWGGTVYGMCKAALERFTTGLASEVYADGIAVNVLSPSSLVATPGVIYHGLTRNVPEDRLEPASVMAEAAYALCTGDPATLTGKVAYAKPVLTELGVPIPTA
jgi:NAD(P)-dependent dehydrogenase (short-subunit alcohol dehydrogenase family)